MTLQGQQFGGDGKWPTCGTCKQPYDPEYNDHSQAGSKSQSYLGMHGCPSCGQTVPARVSVKQGEIHLDGNPVRNTYREGNQVKSTAGSWVGPARSGKGYDAALDRPYGMRGESVYDAHGTSQIGAAKDAVKKVAEKNGQTWEDWPKERHDRVLRQRKFEGYED